MSQIKPIKNDSGKLKEFRSTDTLPPNNLAPTGAAVNGDVIVYDNTVTAGQKWATPASGSSLLMPYFLGT